MTNLNSIISNIITLKYTIVDIDKVTLTDDDDNQIKLLDLINILESEFNAANK